MHIITKDISINMDEINNSTYLSNKDFLIFDIETTGFSRENDIIYMIGFIFKADQGYKYYNLFANDPAAEYKLINYFFKFIEGFDSLIHYNGDGFDIPFLLARAAKYKIADSISALESIDVYKLLRPFRKSLDFPDLKLDTLQKALGYIRKDTSSGGELIKIYELYTQKPYKPYYQLLLRHNQEDVEGMINLLPIIDLMDLINQITSHQDVTPLDISEGKQALKIVFKLPKKVLIDFKFSSKENGKLSLAANSDLALLTLPLYSGEKKFFLENYQDYVYLPDKDEIMHRSLSRFIPANEKQRANKGNCYLRQKGVFMPVLWPDSISTKAIKLFKDDLRSKNYYVLVSQDLDRAFYKKQLGGFFLTI